jgi:NitT/TauT family transport system ATP-binding protein
MVAARLRGVSKRFDPADESVLEDIDLDVAAGEFVCLVGASGCGKSTLLSILAGLDQPTSGTVRAAAAAMMFQEPALLPWLTAGKNVELALRLHGLSRDQRRARVAELLALVHLAGAGERRPHELSGGTQQRAALARALAQERDLLLMDEPFAALDAITRDLLHDELEGVWQRTGSAVLFVTHNAREAVRLGDRVVLLSSRPGRIAAQWQVEIPRPRRIESPEVARMAFRITDALRHEIHRHAA